MVLELLSAKRIFLSSNGTTHFKLLLLPRHYLKSSEYEIRIDVLWLQETKFLPLNKYIYNYNIYLHQVPMKIHNLSKWTFTFYTSKPYTRNSHFIK